MNMSQTKVETSAGFIQLCFCDEKNNRFVILGGAGFLTEQEVKLQWDSLPKFEGKTSFIADLLDADKSIIDDRPVSAETCELMLGSTIAELINAGRIDADKEQRLMEQTA